ncbi:MAG TPA: glycosyltransferase [Chloroflexia bacterium]|nr:glycosyltransferase [Chloroflexia bacterium]
MLTLLEIFLVIASLLLTIQSAYSASIMLYAWEDEDRQQRNRVPQDFGPPRLSFTLLLPARHEEAVIQGTIQRLVDLNYPPELVQLLIIIEATDSGTIEAVNQKLAELHRAGVTNVRLLTYNDPPVNKPHGLNVGLAQATGDVITIFDAEDEPHPDILAIVNTVMLREELQVVQCGVQLMNFADRWYSSLNVLEYFFWFRSRLHFHSLVNMVPLGGNTIFIKYDVLKSMGGWDQNCLTEDADIGVRLSVAGLPIRVLYDDRYVTREETPPTVSQFIKQRTRWNQGFLQVLAKKDWQHLPLLRQRLLAFYTLAFPCLQALLLVYLPLSLWMMLFLRLPSPIAIISLFPIYMLGLQLIANVVGLFEFAAVHHLTIPPRLPTKMALVFLPYQFLLSFAAFRAIQRQFKGKNNWEKTVHTGALRKPDLNTIGSRPDYSIAISSVLTNEALAGEEE